jgi:hypothetical protein
VYIVLALSTNDYPKLWDGVTPRKFSALWSGLSSRGKSYLLSLIAPVLDPLLRLDEPHNVETLAAIINWSETSADVIRSTTILLFEKLRADEAVSPLLSAVYQRHPDTFREVANHHRDNLDAPSRDSFERFMISLSFVNGLYSIFIFGS